MSKTNFLIRNCQKTVTFNVNQFKKHVEILIDIFKIRHCEFSVSCIENEEIQDYNSKYRGLNEATDVLAFPCQEVTIPGQLPLVTNSQLYDLGDILLAVPYIKTQCEENSEQLDTVLPVMVTHGLCHLLGYDHETQQQWQQMYNKELHILSKFNSVTGKNCQPLLGVGH